MKKISIYTFLLVLLSSCGFKVVKQSEFINYEVAEVITIGDKKINFKIKNKILSSSKKNESKLIKVLVETKKKKSVKEKNIKNEVTKYKVEIVSKVTLGEISSNYSTEFISSKTGEYSVSTQYSQTLSNEKKIIKLLTENISDEILDKIINRLNAI